MEWLSDIFSVGASALSGVASGGIFGIIGAVVGQVSKHYQEKQRQEWQREKWSQEERLQRLDMERGQQETENEIAITALEGSWSSLEASIQADAKIQASPWANNIRSLFRPVLTLGLIILAAWTFDSILKQIASENGVYAALFTDTEMREIVRYMIQTIFFTASTAALWWFAERAMTPPWAKGR